MAHPVYKPGRNIAMKLPERVYHETLAFYRDILGLRVVEERDDGALVDFGAVRLHLDRVQHQSQTDLWLEVVTDDVDAAAEFLDRNGVTRCDEVEELPPGFQGFWIASPSGTIHLVAKAKAGG